MFAARLRAYAPGGAALGLLPDPLSWQASIVHGDLGALSVTYSTLSAGGPLIARPLADGLEVAVEVWNGTTWVEPRGCRFVRVAQGADTADDMQVYSLTFRAYGWLLSKARLTAGTFTDGRRTFAAPKAGTLVATVLGENAAIGGVPVTVVGGGATDAGGATWPALPDQGFDYAADYLGIVRGLQEAGALDWATQARGLYLYLADSTALSPDLSATVRLRLGRDIGQAPADETIETLVSQVAVRAQAGGTVVVDEPTAPTPWGEWQGSLAVGQVDNQAAAEAMGEAELERSGRAREQYTRDLVLHDAAPIPLVDYWPGAWITAPTSVPAESVRVQQVTLTFGADGFGGNVVLNDRLIEGDIRRARMLATLTGGQVGSGGAPAPIAVDPEASRVPSTPTGLDATTALVFDPTTGAPSGILTATWNPVTTATDSGTLAISGYELQYRVGTGPWQNRSTPEVSAEIAGLLPGDAGETRVRAVGARTTLPSAWSTPDAFVVSGDATPPSVPSAPVAVSSLGVVVVTWDGLTSIGTAMEDDFARVEVGMDGMVMPDPRLDTLVLNPRGAVVNDTHPASGGPDGGSYLRRTMTTANTSSPMNGPLTPGGLNGIPVVEGVAFTPFIWARKSAGGPALRFDLNWLNEAGVLLSTQTGSANSVGSAWAKYSQTFTPPAGATFVQIYVSWTGTALANQTLDLGVAGFEPMSVVGTMARAGVLPVANQPVGSTRTVWLRSVDTSGNRSAWSEPADPTVVVGVTEPDIEAGAVTANAIQAGTLTGDLFAALMVIASMYTTSATGTGQRVEWDQAGIRLYNAAEELWVNLPTGTGENPAFRGEIQADGLTVRGGASFYSTLNEFARDSVIALAEAVTAPIAPPTVSTFWASTQFALTPQTGGLGTFALDPSLIQSVAWNDTSNLILLVQKVASGGSRVWYYTTGGAYNTHWDLPASWDVTSVAVGADGEFRVLYNANNAWWIYDYSQPEGVRTKSYPILNTGRRPTMTMDGNNVWVAETNTSGTLIIRRCTVGVSSTVTIAETVTTSGVADQQLDPVFLYRGSADFGTARFAAGYRNTFTTRVYSTSGAYDATRNFPPPASRAGAFWNPDTSRFYTVGTDGRLYTHSALHWTDPALDTWHLAQSFRDSNATGGLHETVIGAIRTVNPAKRSWLRVLAAQVPYAGGTDDPNQWRLYGKTGTVPPAIGTGMTLQHTASYTSLQTDLGALLSTGGSAPPATSNFPNATPARLRSARTMPSDSTKSILEMRGDGSGWWGELAVSGTGQTDLKVGVFVEIYRSTAQALTSGAEATFLPADVVESTGIAYASGVFTIQRAGLYDVDALLTFGGGSGRRLTRMYVNGAEMARSETNVTTGQASIPVSKTVRLAVNDTVEFTALAGAAVSILPGRGQSYITIARIGS